MQLKMLSTLETLTGASFVYTVGFCSVVKMCSICSHLDKLNTPLSQFAAKTRLALTLLC